MRAGYNSSSWAEKKMIHVYSDPLRRLFKFVHLMDSHVIYWNAHHGMILHGRKCNVYHKTHHILYHLFHITSSTEIYSFV